MNVSRCDAPVTHKTDVSSADDADWFDIHVVLYHLLCVVNFYSVVIS